MLFDIIGFILFGFFLLLLYMAFRTADFCHVIRIDHAWFDFYFTTKDWLTSFYKKHQTDVKLAIEKLGFSEDDKKKVTIKTVAQTGPLLSKTDSTFPSTRSRSESRRYCPYSYDEELCFPPNNFNRSRSCPRTNCLPTFYVSDLCEGLLTFEELEELKAFNPGSLEESIIHRNFINSFKSLWDPELYSSPRTRTLRQNSNFKPLKLTQYEWDKVINADEDTYKDYLVRNTYLMLQKAGFIEVSTSDQSGFDTVDQTRNQGRRQQPPRSPRPFYGQKKTNVRLTHDERYRLYNILKKAPAPDSFDKPEEGRSPFEWNPPARRPGTPLGQTTAATRTTPKKQAPKPILTGRADDAYDIKPAAKPTPYSDKLPPASVARLDKALDELIKADQVDPIKKQIRNLKS
jgi:hypothetical protein